MVSKAIAVILDPLDWRKGTSSLMFHCADSKTSRSRAKHKPDNTPTIVMVAHPGIFQGEESEFWHLTDQGLTTGNHGFGIYMSCLLAQGAEALERG